MITIYSLPFDEEWTHRRNPLPVQSCSDERDLVEAGICCRMFCLGKYRLDRSIQSAKDLFAPSRLPLITEYLPVNDMKIITE